MNNPAYNAGLGNTFSSYRFAFISVGVFSAVVNLLLLTGPIFMLQVYDRVLASQSVPTLTALILLVAFLFAFYAVLETIRLRILARVGAAADGAVCDHVFEQSLIAKSNSGAARSTSAPRDLDTIRQFLSGPAPIAFFDLPWLPLFLGVVFLLHFWLGVTATVGAIILFVLATLNELMMRRSRRSTAGLLAQKQRLFGSVYRHSETVRALGMIGAMTARWRTIHDETVCLQNRLSDVSGGFSSAIKGIRLLLQSIILGVGAYLAIHQQVSAGAMIAASIIAARALAPLELAVGNWRQYGEALQAYRHLSDVLTAPSTGQESFELPPPRAELLVEDVSFTPAGRKQPVLSGLSFEMTPGMGLAVLGPSASGKSTLARLLAGIIDDYDGDVRLDGATFGQWHHDAIGRHIGYMSQNAALFPGTIAENISRFAAEADTRAIITASKAAHVHDLILSLPNGYETQCDEACFDLSAGQRQRIALARALYGDPFLIILDEANSNLDAAGETALVKSILAARERGAIVIAMAHRPSILAAVSHVMLLQGGKPQAFGEKDDVLPAILKPAGEGRHVA